MIALLLLALAQAPSPVALTVLMSPRDSLSSFGGSEVLRALGAAIGEATSLEAVTAERAGIDLEPLSACTGQEDSGCWTRAVREAKYRLRFRFLFVASLERAGETKDRVTVLLVDTEGGQTIRGGPEEASSEDPGALDALLKRYFRGPFRDLLAELPPAAPLVATASATVSEDINYRSTLTIAGASSAAIGTALLVVAIVSANRAPGVVCLARDPAAAGNCGSLGHAAFSYRTEDLPSRRLDIERGFLRPGPLGAGFIAAGACVAISARFFDPEEWWWPVLTGLAAGTSTYLVTSVID